MLDLWNILPDNEYSDFNCITEYKVHQKGEFNFQFEINGFHRRPILIISTLSGLIKYR